LQFQLLFLFLLPESDRLLLLLLLELLDQLLLLGNVDGGIKAVTTYLGIYQTVTRGRELGLYSSLAAYFLLKFVTVVCTLELSGAIN